MAGRTFDNGFDDGSLDWADLYAFVFAAPPNTSIFHAFEKGWTTTDYLVAHMVDAARVANWQRTEDAQKRNPEHAPEPLPRPSDANPKVQQEKQDTGSKRVVQVGAGITATPTTVGRFLEIRADREKRWRERHQKPERGKESP